MEILVCENGYLDYLMGFRRADGGLTEGFNRWVANTYVAAGRYLVALKRNNRVEDYAYLYQHMEWLTLDIAANDAMRMWGTTRNIARLLNHTD